MNSPTVNHPPNLIHVIHGSPSIRYKHETIPKIGTSGTKGVLKLLSLEGSFFLRIIIPMQTRMNANRVPMFVRSTISSILVNIEVMPTTAPVRIVVTYGVLNLGWTLEKLLGNSPSLEIEKNILGCPS